MDLGKSRSSFGEFIVGKTPERGAVAKPYGVALFEGKLYAVDTQEPGYAIFDLKEKSIRLITGSGSGSMRKPINITIDQKGNKYITDTGRDQVMVFDREERFVRAYGAKDQFKPGDVAIVGDRLYISDLKKHEQPSPSMVANAFAKLAAGMQSKHLRSDHRKTSKNLALMLRQHT